MDGVLVEKTMGYKESLLAVEIAYLLKSFLREHDLGIVLGEAGTLRILPGSSAGSRRLFPLLGSFSEPTTTFAADPGVGARFGYRDPLRRQHRSRNAAQIARLFHGRRAVGVVHRSPHASAKSYTAENQLVEVSENASLSGGDVLPGFELPLGGLFAKVRA